MNQLSTFNFEHHEVRTIKQNNDVWFCLKDVCDVLGLSNSRKVTERLNQKGVTTSDTLTKGGIQKMNFINESNLYKVIFQSRKPQAERFTEWVTSEVLPTIRMTGGYNLKLTPEQKIDLLLQASSNSNKRVEAVEQRIANLEENRFLNPNEYGYLNTQVSARIKQIKDAHQWKLNRKQNSELFRSLGYDIKQITGVKCRSQIRLKDFDKVIEFVRTWEPSQATKLVINQMILDV